MLYLLAHVQDEIYMQNQLRNHWEVTRDPTLNAEINCVQMLVTCQLNEWRTDLCRNRIQNMTMWVMQVLTLTPPLIKPGGFAV